MKCFIYLSFLLSTVAIANGTKKITWEESSFPHELLEINMFISVYQINSTDNLFSKLRDITEKVRAEWGNYSAPSRVDLRKVDQEFSLFVPASFRPRPSFLTQEKLALIQSYSRPKDIVLFEGEDENSFYNCSNAYLFSPQQLEIAIFSNCYFE